MSRGRNGAAGAAKGARGAPFAAPAAGGRGKGRWSARRKMTVVLELLRGAGAGNNQPQVRGDGSHVDPLAGSIS